MRKFICFMMCTFISVQAMSTEVLICDIVKSWTNKTEKCEIADFPSVAANRWQIEQYVKHGHEDLLSEFDEVLAGKLPMEQVTDSYFPKTWTNVLAKIAVYRGKNLADLYEKYGSKSTSEWTISEMLSVKFELGDSFKQSFASKCAPYIREFCFNNGLGVATRKLEDGTEYNPLKQTTDELVKCLNAPRLSGLTEWLDAVCGIQYEFGDDAFYTDDEISSVCSGIVSGKISYANVRSKLILSMGVDGLNDFINKYNGK